MRPPPGFETQKFPLRHKFYHACGLNTITTGKNTAHFPIIRNYKSSNAPDTIDVNPHNSAFDKETGAICNPMSIIDKLKIKLTFSYTEENLNLDNPTKFWWQPLFFSFKEKLEAADDFTTTTVATILQLVQEAGKEDVTPIYNNLKHTVLGSSTRSHPLSTVNATESVAILNMDTDATSEGVTWDDVLVQNAMLHFTNKGALKACMGRRRWVTLSRHKTHQSFFLDKPAPRPVRRVMPYSYMGIVIHVPKVTDEDQYYMSGSPTATIGYIGVTCKVKYDEWHFDHNQAQAGT